MQFGHSFKKKYFPASDNSFVPVNHGSYGLPPQSVIEQYIKAFKEDLASPDSYMRLEQPRQYTEGLKAIAGILNCSFQNLAIVNNATSGANTVLRSFPFAKGDVIAYPSTTYGSCANTIKFLAKQIGIVPVVVELDFPMSDAEVVAKFEKTFREQKVKLALFDTVVSMPGVKLPFQALTRLCAENGVLSLVDGAHSIGLIPIDLGKPEFQPDFYVSNLHKWLSLPRGCAVLYVAPEHHRAIQTMPISHSYVDSETVISDEELQNLLVSKFTFVGSETFAALACIPAAIKFRQEKCGGENAIRKYCEGLARQVADLAPRKWPGAQVLENSENSLITAMVTIVVPMYQYSRTFDPRDASQMKQIIAFLSKELVEKHNTFVPFAAHNDKVVARFSGQIYNELSDYEYAIAAAQEALSAFFGTVAHKSHL